MPPVSKKSVPKKLIEYTHMYTYNRNSLLQLNRLQKSQSGGRADAAAAVYVAAAASEEDDGRNQQ